MSEHTKRQRDCCNETVKYQRFAVEVVVEVAVEVGVISMNSGNDSVSFGMRVRSIRDLRGRINLLRKEEKMKKKIWKK